MVNATVDNEPVSIILNGGESTTVPSNETWKVSIHLSNNKNFCTMSIDGIGDFIANRNGESAQGNYLDITLTGGQTVTETSGNSGSCLFITGFVVNS